MSNARKRRARFEARQVEFEVAFWRRQLIGAHERDVVRILEWIQAQAEGT